MMCSTWVSLNLTYLHVTGVKHSSLFCRNVGDKVATFCVRTKRFSSVHRLRNSVGFRLVVARQPARLQRVKVGTRVGGPGLNVIKLFTAVSYDFS
jgi:hypothetical protein